MPDTVLERTLAFIAALPFSQALGMRVLAATPGEVTLEMPYDARMIGDPATGCVHGGVAFALMDTCAGAAVLSHPARPATTATLDLRIDYLRAARAGRPLIATAHCFHMTHNVAFVRTLTRDQPDGAALATGTGAFIVAGLDAPADPAAT